MTEWLLALQAITNVFLLLTLVVYFLQWRAMRSQVRAASEQIRIAKGEARAQNLFSLITFLQDPEARDARAWVLQKLPGKEFEVWSDEDRNNASRVSSKYDVVGLLVREGIVPESPVLTSWGPSIRLCFESLEPFIRSMQAKHGTSYWDDFEWLYNEVKSRDRSETEGTRLKV